MAYLFLFLFISLIGVTFFYANWVVYKKNAFIARHINTRVKRNVRRLVLGDWCDLNDKFCEHEVVSYLSPSFQSEQMVTLLVKRLYSLLDENNGVLTIVRNAHNKTKEGISIFDIPYLHENTLADLNKSWMKRFSFFPFVFDLCGSSRLLLNRKGGPKLILCSCPIPELVSFCNSRNIKLEYYKIL